MYERKVRECLRESMYTSCASVTAGLYLHAGVDSRGPRVIIQANEIHDLNYEIGQPRLDY